MCTKPTTRYEIGKEPIIFLQKKKFIPVLRFSKDNLREDLHINYGKNPCIIYLTCNIQIKATKYRLTY